MIAEYATTKKRILQKAIFILLFLLVEAIAWGKVNLVGGLLVGAAGSLFNFWHLNRTYTKVFNGEVDEKRLLNYVYSKYSFRLAFSLILLGFSMKLGKDIFLGAIIGFLIPKAAIFLENALEIMQNYFSNYLAKIRRR